VAGTEVPEAQGHHATAIRLPVALTESGNVVHLSYLNEYTLRPEVKSIISLLHLHCANIGTRMDYNELCKDILGLDTKIRFAGVCDDTGEIRFGGPREGIKSLLTPEQTKVSNLQALIRWELRDSLSHKIGRENILWKSMKRSNA